SDLTGPTTDCPSLDSTCNGEAEFNPCIADHLTVTSPANSVFITSSFPSDFRIVPVRRSPFFNTIWSANKKVERKKIDSKVALGNLCTDIHLTGNLTANL